MKTKLAGAQPKIITAVMCLMLLSCGGSDVDNQTNLAPVARAVALGAGVDSDPYKLRSGMDVLVSGKDSYGTDAPILDYEWTVTNVSGGGLTAEKIRRALYERTVNTKRFRAPDVLAEAMVELKLTVTDADGDQSSDSLQLLITPVRDPDHFLIQDIQETPADSLANTYDILAVLDLMPTTSGLAFEFKVETWVEWSPREEQSDSDCCRMILPELTKKYKGSWPVVSGEETPGIDASYTQLFQVEIPSLIVDEINYLFETENRGKRLNLWDVGSARLEQQIVFTASNSPGPARLLITNGSEGDTGLLSLDWNSSQSNSAIISVEDIRRAFDRESMASANAYYESIDPGSKYERFSAWLSAKGFSGGAPQENVAHAVYVNNYDLGFGRDMFMRRDDCGNVYSYVSNYPSLEAAIKRQGNFAIVVMEYSPLNDMPDNLCSEDEKIVKFYAYVPDDQTGDPLRMASMNFDGRGEKFVPGVCTACHGGSPGELHEYDESFDPAILAELDSTFMPFDLDSFLYASSGVDEPEQNDPDLNPDNLPDSVNLELYSREAQLDDFDEFNSLALLTYLHKSGCKSEGRFAAPINLVDSWYSTSIGVMYSTNVSGCDQDQLFSDVETLISSDFNGASRMNDSRLELDPDYKSASDSGWRGATEKLHTKIFARHCRACHIQLANVNIQFDTEKEFRENNNIVDSVLVAGTMPMARLTMDRFWTDFDGDSFTAASFFQTEFDSDAVPGQPNAVIEVEEKNRTISELVDEMGDVTVEIDGSKSSFFEELNWSVFPEPLVTDVDCSSAVLANTSSLTPTLAALQSPCKYVIQLDLLVGNIIGDSVRTDDTAPDQSIIVSRVPKVEANFLFTVDSPRVSYVPGNNFATITINVIDGGNVIERGDDSLKLFNWVDSQYFAAVAGDTSVTVFFDPLKGTSEDLNEEFSYRLQDVDGSESNKGKIIFSIAPIRPIVNATSTTGQVSLTWEVPAGFEASSYRVRRAVGVDPMSDDFSDLATDLPKTQLWYDDNSLAAGMTYNYQVIAILNGAESDPGEIDIQTNDAPVPDITSIAADLTSVTLTWTNPSPDVSSFKVLRTEVGGSDDEIDTGGTGVIYTDNDLPPGTSYVYKVEAIYSGGASSLSASETVATDTLLPPANAAIAGDLTETTRFTLTWDATSSDIPDGTIVQYEVKKDGVEVAGSPVSATSLPVDYVSGEGIFDLEVNALVNGVSSVAEVLSLTTSYVNNVDDIISDEVTCARSGCHNASARGGLDTSGTPGQNWQALRDDLLPAGDVGTTTGSRLNFFSLELSTILTCVESGCGSMNSKSGVDVSAIRAWLSEGGLYN